MLVSFIGLQKLRKLKLAIDSGYATPLLYVAPTVQSTLNSALLLYEDCAKRYEILSKPLVSLADKVGLHPTGEWGLARGVDSMEFILALEVLASANEEVRRD